MQVSRIIAAFAIAALATTACADTEPDTELGEVPPATEAAPDGAAVDATEEMPEHTIAMEPLGGAALTGQVEIDDDDGVTEVDVQIGGSTNGAVHQGHIHTGSCDAPGTVVQPLAPVTVGDDGQGTSENDLQLDYATTTDGQHIVVFHEANGSPGTPVLCVAIPSHATM